MERAVADPRVGASYEADRERWQRRTAGLKRDRRIVLGTFMVVFENAATIAHALEEALRSDRITDDPAVAAEHRDFEALAPLDRELCGCLYVNARDHAELGSRLADLAVARAALYLDVDGSRVEVIGDDDEQLSRPAVCVVRFRLNPEQRRRLQAGASVTVGIDHPVHRAAALLTEAQRRALQDDLG
ncbi:MAG: DUF3501 family protein [Candidatus Dormibacteria bacterium]